MAHTHEFDCKICGAHLDSRNELDQHNVKNHPDVRSASSGSSQSFSSRGQAGDRDQFLNRDPNRPSK